MFASKSVVLTLMSAALLVGNLMEADTLSPRPAALSPSSTVHAHLDIDGSELQYSDHSILRDYIGQRLAAFRLFLSYMPAYSTEKGRRVKQQIADISDRFADEFLEGLEGVGDSVKADSGYFVRKNFLAIQTSCPVLEPFIAMDPSDIEAPAIAPVDTDLLVVQELDPVRLVDRATSFIGHLQIPGLVLSKDQITAQLSEIDGVPHDLSEFGSKIAMFLRIGQDPISIQGFLNGVQKPQVAFMLFPPDNRFAARLIANLNSSKEVTKSEFDGFTIFSQDLGNDFPLDRAVLGIGKGIVIVGSEDQFIRDIIDTKSGKHPALSSDTEFKRLSANMPVKANSYYYGSLGLRKYLSAVSAPLFPDLLFSEVRTLPECV